jgi:hypothetical protein
MSRKVNLLGRCQIPAPPGLVTGFYKHLQVTRGETNAPASSGKAALDNNRIGRRALNALVDRPASGIKAIKPDAE